MSLESVAITTIGFRNGNNLLVSATWVCARFELSVFKTVNTINFERTSRRNAYWRGGFLQLLIYFLSNRIIDY